MEEENGKRGTAIVGEGRSSFSFFMAQVQNYEKHDLSLKKTEILSKICKLSITTIEKFKI